MNKYIKFLIAGLMIAAGVYLMMNRQIGWGIVVVFFSLSPILLFFKNEYILLAFWQMRKQNFIQWKNPDIRRHNMQHEELFCCHSAEWVEEVRKAVEGDR